MDCSLLEQHSLLYLLEFIITVKEYVIRSAGQFPSSIWRQAFPIMSDSYIGFLAAQKGIRHPEPFQFTR
jgi:hypothetical protein